MSSTSTRQLYGFDFGGDGDMGGNKPPFIDGNLAGNSGNYISVLSSLKAKGCQVIMKFPGPSALYKDSSGFSLTMWKSKMSQAVFHYNSTSPAISASVISAQIAAFVNDGTLIANYMIDDFKSGTAVFGGNWPTYQDIEDMAAYSKSLWPALPCTARAENQYFKNLADNASKTSYVNFDFGWGQSNDQRTGKVTAWFQGQVNDGKAVNLGTLVGFNLLNGGKGTDPNWQQHPDRANHFGMNPTEITEIKNAYITVRDDVLGIYGWSCNPQFDTSDYYDIAAIQAPMQDIVDAAIGHTRGPLRPNTPSGSTQTTVIGDWAVRSIGPAYRTNNPSAPTITMSGCEANDLQFLVTYTRDSGRSVVKPSDMNLVTHVSGNSAQGGDLALWYKLATSADSGLQRTLSLLGSATNTAFQAISFAFSGNTTVNLHLLDNTASGSGSSWPGGSSNMGPVRGFTSSSSDCLILIVAAKTNDFNNGDPVPNDTMSATTHDAETWNRLFLSTNVSGDDSGILVDWCAMNGRQSITTKSWTQVTGAGSSASGSGCGLMASFTPAVVESVTAQPPGITDTGGDFGFTLNLGDTLSITATASGTTPITWSKVSAPSNFTLNTSTGALSWTPLAAGSYYMIVRATNSAGTDDDDFTATVLSQTQASNNTPVIVSPGDKTVMAQDRLGFIVVATDADGDAVLFDLENGALAGSLIDLHTGQFTWIPTGEQGPGTYPVVILASDGQLTSRSTFTITVTDAEWTRDGGPAAQLVHGTNPTNSFRRI